MFNDAPPFLDELTTFLTNALAVDVNIFTTSGITAPAIVPQVIITESFHQRPFAKSPIIRLETTNVKAIETKDVIHTNEVKGASKFILSALPYLDFATAPFIQYETALAINIISLITNIQTKSLTWFTGSLTASITNVTKATPVTP